MKVIFLFLSTACQVLTRAENVIEPKENDHNSQDLSEYNHQPLQQHQPRTLIEVTATNTHLSTIVDAKRATEFAALLNSVGNFTFFAPDNSAFVYMHEKTPELMDVLFTTKAWLCHLQNLLAYHVIQDEAIFSSDVIHESTAVQTRNGDSVYLTRYEGHLYVWPALHGGYARVVTPDNGSTNGVAHFVDSVLLAQWLTRSLMDLTVHIPQLSTFRYFVVAAGLESTIGYEFGYTVGADKLKNCDFGGIGV